MEHEFPPELVEQHISNRVFVPILAQIRQRFGDERLHALLEASGLPLSYLNHTDGWVSVLWNRRLNDAIASQIYNLEHWPPMNHQMWTIYSAAGRKGFTRKALGPIYLAVKALSAPRQVYRSSPRLADRANRVVTVELVEDRPGLVVLSARPGPQGIPDLPNGCASRRGFMEAVPELWGYPPARVEHTQCIHDRQNPASSCVYRVHYRGRGFSSWLDILGATVAGSAGLALLDLTTSLVANIPLAAVVGGALGLGLASLRRLQIERAARQDEARDFTEELKTFDERYIELRESEQRFQQLIKHIAQVFWLSTPDRSRYHYISPTYESVFGQSRQAVLDDGALWWKAVYPEDRDRLRKELTDFSGVGEWTYRIDRADGTQSWIRERAFGIRDHQQQIYRLAGFSEDITEAIRSQTQKRQAQKMEAIGRLAGGIAHDFNNLLTIILGFAEQLGEELPKEGDQADKLEQISNAAGNAASLTSQLLAFSRQQVLEMKAMDLNLFIDARKRLFRALCPCEIELTFKLDQARSVIAADAAQLTQVLMNLIINARDAIAESGQINVETRSIQLDALEAHRHWPIQPGNYMLLKVTDSGSGMSDDVLERLFEPFFTTKPVGEGTGLGLATVQGIVEQHSGVITCESELGKGSSFSIYLPEIESDILSSDHDSLPEFEGPPRQRTILICEDEAPLRMLLTAVLGRAGYKVLVAATPHIAIEIGKRTEVHIDLLLTDVVMPELSGIDVVQAVVPFRPNMEVLYTSGYNDDMIRDHGISAADVNFLQKPYKINKLLATVSELIGVTVPE